MFSASYTTAIPPRPISLEMRYLPTRTVPIGTLEVGSAAIVTGTLENQLLGSAFRASSKQYAQFLRKIRRLGCFLIVRARCVQSMPIEHVQWRPCHIWRTNID